MKVKKKIMTTKIPGAEVLQIGGDIKIDNPEYFFIEVEEQIRMCTTEKHRKQQLFLYHFQMNNFNVIKACKAVPIIPNTYFTWRKDPKFLDQLNEIKRQFIDLAEHVIYQKLEEGDANVAMFVLKTLDRDRWGATNGSFDQSAFYQKNHNITVNVPMDLLGVANNFNPIDPKIIEIDEAETDG